MSTTLERLTAPDALRDPQETTTAAMLPAGTTNYLWAVVRICLGWTFLWPFLDKTFGLHNETASADAWIHGGSPTEGFLAHAVGPFAGMYHSMAGNWWADWGFMVGLLCIGVALLLGIGMRIASVSGALLLVLMWTAVFPPDNNPFMDDHIIYALVLLGLALVGAGNTLGLGRLWTRTNLVRKHGWLT